VTAVPAPSGPTGATDHRGRPRVVVTGMGVKAPGGLTVDELWASLMEPRPAAAPVTLFDASELSVGFACEVTGFDPEPYVGPKEVRRTDRVALLGIAASSDALDAAHARAPLGVESVRCGGAGGA